MEKITKLPIKKNWFRNYYLVRMGVGMASYYKVFHWKDLPKGDITVYGPFFTCNQANEIADKINADIKALMIMA